MGAIGVSSADAQEIDNGLGALCRLCWSRCHGRGCRGAHYSTVARRGCADWGNLETSKKGEFASIAYQRSSAHSASQKSKTKTKGAVSGNCDQNGAERPEIVGGSVREPMLEGVGVGVISGS